MLCDEYIDNEMAFVAVNVLVVIVNKYVLSTLHFTLPTVFQGWQTLVCVLMLSVRFKCNQFLNEIHKLDQETLKQLIMLVLLFSLGNVAGSKALSDLPVAVFLAGSNAVPAGIVLYDSLKSGTSPVRAAGSLALLSSVIASYAMYQEGNVGWMWLLIHLVSLAIHSLKITSLKLHAVTSIYYLNFTSVLLLLPLSIYLQEAHSAFNHARQAKLEFYVGCCLSGVLGTGVQLIAARLSSKASVTFYSGVAKILACSVSLLVFPNNLSPLQWLTIVANLVIGCFLAMSRHDLENPKSAELSVV